MGLLASCENSLLPGPDRAPGGHRDSRDCSPGRRWLNTPPRPIPRGATRLHRRVSDGEDAVVVTVTAKDASGQDVASANGWITVSYDASAMTLKRVAVSADYHSVVESNGTVIRLCRRGANCSRQGNRHIGIPGQWHRYTEVTVQHQQVNDLTPAYDETVPIDFAHPNTELRDAKEATCTEDGYTGDVYCTDCGLLLQKGEVIPAKGHTEKTEGAIEATCGGRLYRKHRLHNLRHADQNRRGCQPKDIPWNCEMGRSPPVPRLVIPVIITVFPAIRSL